MKTRFILTLTIILLSQFSFAQLPLPASEQKEAIALSGGIAHLGNGEVIQNSIIGFDNGMITFALDASANPDLSNYTLIDISGQHVYPGFILPNSEIGLAEIGAVDASVDKNEVGDMNPNIRSLIAYNTDSKIIPTLRFNGILIAETTPSGGRISGTSSAMNMEGWNWEDAVLKTDIGVHMNWPNRISWNFDMQTWSYKKEANKKYSQSVNELKAFFDDAMAYSKSSKKRSNMKLEAMKGLFTGEKTLFINAGSSKEIIESVVFAQQSGVLKIVIITSTGAIDAAPFLVENQIPVVLQNLHRLPDNSDMEVNLPYQLAYLLNEAGVLVSLAHSGSVMRSRNLPFYAGTAVAYGVDKEDAIKMITLNTARVLGIDNEVGSLEKGKRATLFVSSGDALDMRTNNVQLAFIDGKLIDLNGEQQALYERYTEKYKAQGLNKQ
jgi:hypothetical protein